MEYVAGSDAKWLIFLGTLIGAFLGAIGSIVTVLITKIYEERKQKRELFVSAAIENWKAVIDHAKVQGGPVHPLDDFVVHWLIYSELIVGQRLKSADDVKKRLRILQGISDQVAGWRKEEGEGKGSA